MGGAADTVAVRPVNGGAPARGEAAGGASASSGAGLRLLKLFIGVALIPACVGMTLAVQDHFWGAWQRLNFAVQGPGLMLKWFGIGILTLAAITIFVWRPVAVYVFGHELMHAIAAWLCLGSVSNLTASATGGQVTTSKTNTFIRLAPYCVPVYALMAAAVYAGLHTWWRPLDDYAHILAFVLGILYAFHTGFSLWSLRRDQPDLKTDGWLFSLVLIYAANLCIFVLLASFLLDGTQFRQIADEAGKCGKGAWQHTIQIYRNLGAAIEHTFTR